MTPNGSGGRTRHPKRGQRTLTGQGGVQGLDGTAHADRKAMFMSIMTPSAVARLGQLFADQWRAGLAGWGGPARWCCYDEVGPLLTPGGLRLGGGAAAGESRSSGATPRCRP